jgi:indolepyruvate ferredoxin oxidoreductase alpha subunit
MEGGAAPLLPSHREVLAPPGSRVLMLGNVAAARGFLEAGVQFAAGYPGTPSSEILEALALASKAYEGAPYVEWSVNEKVALEAALGAAIAGARSVATMKHVGMNVAADPLFSSAYLGVQGALVAVTADDPWMWSSQNEQDNRWYGLHAYIPVVEPTGAQDAKEAARLALEYSAKYRRPFIFRTVTRVAHTRVPVETGHVDPEKLRPRGSFVKDPARWTLIPQYARMHRLELLEFWNRVRHELAGFPLNRSAGGGGGLAVLGAGLGYRYALEAARALGVADDVTIYAVSTTVPLPEPLVEKLASHGRVLVVEEGDPVAETQLRAELQEMGIEAKVYGKMGREPLLPRHGELGLDKVTAALSKLTGAPAPSWARGSREEQVAVVEELPPRPPVLCPGCPYRSFLYALRRAVNGLRLRPVYSGDIGCYSLAILPPFQMQDTIIDMGASISAGSGMAHVLRGDPSRVVIALIGDSTFFHSGLTGLANAVYNKSPLLVIVLDNYTTAMTGHQPHPGVGVDAAGRPAPSLSIEEAARGLGVEKILVADAFNIRDSEKKLTEALRYVVENRRPAVVVAKGSCILVALQEARRRGVKPPVYYVDPDRCTGCGICYTAFNCPAISRAADGKAVIDPALCTGCGECAQVCPFGAFRPSEPPSSEWEQIMRTARPKA